MSRREFPADQDVFESVNFRFDKGTPAALFRVVSDRRTADVTISIGGTRLVLSGANCRGLAEMLGEHVDHLGPELELMMVHEGIVDE